MKALITSSNLTFANFAPAIFVILWSTGFVGARYGLPYAKPFSFLFIRMVIVATILIFVSLIRREKTLTLTQIGHSSVTGLFLHVGYLGGVFSAIYLGMPSAMAALVVGLQPILSTILAQRLLKEVVSAKQWLGLSLGFLGVVFVVSEKLFKQQHISLGALVAIIVGLISTTLATLYQKRFAQAIPLLSGAMWQYIAAALVFTLLAFGIEGYHITWTSHFVFALFWLIFVLSLGAIGILLYLIRQHSVSSVSSLMYLVPPATAIEAYFLFNEQLGLAAIFGMLLSALGVMLALKKL